MDLYRESNRISKSVKADRDLLIYIAWQLSVATNQQIGEKFGLTYSAVSQWVSVIKQKLNKCVIKVAGKRDWPVGGGCNDFE
jgi:chromosomal replication initiation ATPase DnaA